MKDTDILCRYVNHLGTSELFIPYLERKILPCNVPLPQMAKKISEIPESDFCELVADDKEKFPACKAKLMACSAFFGAMFNSPMIESHSREIKIREISSESLAKIVSACNSAELILKDYNEILELLALAEQYQMPEFKLDLLSFLETTPMDAFWHPTKCLNILTKVLETVPINNNTEKGRIATWIVNNWYESSILLEVEPILEYFEYYLDLSRLNFSHQ